MKQYIVGSSMEHLALDILSPLPVTDLGNKYILIVADYILLQMGGSIPHSRSGGTNRGKLIDEGSRLSV